MTLMKTSSFDSDQQAWFSKLEQKVSASRISLNSKPIDLPQHFLLRPALVQRLSKGKPVTWLLAPAGYGKSVAISHWYTQFIEPSETLGIWLNLDQKDNLEAFLLRHVLETINHSIPSVATDALALATARHEQGNLNSEDILLLLLDELQDLNCPIVLVFDNLHVIDDIKAWSIIEYLMTHVPNNIRLIISSRYIPVSLGRLRLNPNLEFINTLDLAFSPQEISAWLANSGINDPQQALSLTQRMQGWPAGLGLWLLSQQNNSTLDNSTALDSVGQKQGELSDYLVGEVLNGLEDALQTFLIQIAPLKNFNEGLCNHVLNIDDSRHWIQQLVQHNVFIESIDLKTGWYRLHPMLVELLSNFSTSEQQKKIHTSAFHFLKQEGVRVEALQHARLGELTEDAVKWVENEIDRIIADLDFSGVLAWCDVAGEDLISRSLRLQLVQVWSLLLTYQYQQAIAQITHIDSSQIELEFPGQLLAIKGYIARIEGDDIQARSLCELALRELPQDRFAIRVLMCSTLTNIELVRKDPEAARVWNRLEIDIARKHHATRLELLAQFDYARVELFRGNISRSAEIVDQGLILAKEVSAQSRLFPRARLILHRALVRWLNGDKAGALEDAYAGIDEANNCRDVTVLHGYSLIASINLCDQNASAALDQMAQAERLMQYWKVSDSVYQPWIETIKANAWMLLGKWQRAQQGLDFVAQHLKISQTDSSEHHRSELFPMLSGLYRLSAVRLMLHNEQYHQAQKTLQPVISYGQAGVIQLAAYLLSAVVYAEKDQIDEAKVAWQQGMEFAEKEAISVQIDAFIPGLLTTITNKLASSSKHSEAISDKATQASIAEASNLSAREKEVLALIANGSSNQDIADQLFISLHTVKTHARKINAKLGAKSRTHAIVKARELAII